MIAGGHGNVNPNASWLNDRGMWLFYIFAVALLHLVLLANPFISVPLAWTLTNLLHNLGAFIVFHVLKGEPWESTDQGTTRRLTHWEQLDFGEQFTNQRKFLTVIPILLFFLASFYTSYDAAHFVVNSFAMALLLIPKLPQLHKKRLFGINKY